MLQKATAAKFVITCFFAGGEQLARAEKKLVGTFGKIDYVSPSYKLDQVPELLLLQRGELGYHFRIYSFYRLIARAEMVDLQKKALTCMSTELLEKDTQNNKFKKFFACYTGYVTLSNVISARFEENFGRIYLYNGIYAQPEFVFENGSYRALEFSSPEYRVDAVPDYFVQIRSIYQKQLSERYKD